MKIILIVALLLSAMIPLTYSDDTFEPSAYESLHYDNGINSIYCGQFFITFPYYYVVSAIRLTPTELSGYNGSNITSVLFWHNTSLSETNQGCVEVYSNGTSTYPGTRITNESFNVSGEGWKEITLSSPVTIDETEEYWIGVNITTSGGSDWIITDMDSSAHVAGKGAWVWTPIIGWEEVGNVSGDPWEDYNVMIRAGLEILPQNWWNTNWACRKLITIDSDFIDENLYNFTFTYDTTDLYFIIFSQDDGDDIVFIDYTDNSTQLNHHIEYFDGLTGELTAFFKVPFVSNSTDTKIWCYFGNDNATNTQNETGSWDSHYMMVHHLNGSSYTTCLDSTSNNNDPTVGTGTYQSDGKLGYAVDLETSSSEYLQIPDSSSLKPPNQITIEAWIKPESLAGPTTGRIVTKWTYGGIHPGYSFYRSSSIFGFQLNVNNVLKSGSYSSTITTGNWYHLVMSYDNTSIAGYKNGAFVSSVAASGSLTHTGAVLYIGRYSGGEYFDGLIDEVRISDIGRNASWIETTYNTQNGTNGSQIVGELETTLSNIPPLHYNPSPANNAIDINLNPTLVVDVLDFDGDTVNITWQTNATGAWGTIGTNNSVSNGTYRQTNNSMGSFSTKYYWRVIVDDGMGNTFNGTYSFTTLANVAPTNIRSEPYNQALMVDLQPWIGIYASDYENQSVNITFFTNATDGVNWTVIGTNNSIYSNEKYRQQFLNASSYNTKYWWAVNTTDSEGAYDNDTFWFITSEYVSTYVEPISQYNVTTSSVNLPINAQSNLDNVSLYYRYTSDNDTALRFKNITIGGFAKDGVGGINNLDYPNSHIVIDDVAYIAVYGDDRLLMLDISNLSNITEISDTGSQDAHDIVIRDNYAYIVSYIGNYFFAWDISNISSPQLKDSILLPSDYGMYILVDENYAYVSQYTGSTGKWSIIDITDPSNLFFVNNQSETDIAWHFDKFGDILYMHLQNGGIRIYNVSDPYNIAYVTTIASGQSISWELRPLNRNDFKYLVGANSTGNHIAIYNITTSITNPTLVSATPASNSGAHTVYGNYQYIGLTGSGFSVYNLTDIYNLQQITTIVNASLTQGPHEFEFGYDDAWTFKNEIPNPYYMYMQGYVSDSFVAYEINYINERSWVKYGEDSSYPFSFDFNFPNGTGYYEFYSAGKKAGALDEPLPEIYYPPDEMILSSNQPPNQPTNEIPASGSNYVLPETHMNVTVSDPNGGNLSVSYYLTELGENQTYEYFIPTGDYFFGEPWLAQLFTVGDVGKQEDFYANSVRCYIRKNTPVLEGNVSICTVNESQLPDTYLTSVDIDFDEVPDEFGWVTFDFTTHPLLENGIQYALVIDFTGTADIEWRVGPHGDGYSGGYAIYNGHATPNKQYTRDFFFEITGYNETMPILITTKENIINNSVASIYLPDYEIIEHDTSYHWYVVITDGMFNTTSSTWLFHTSMAWDIDGDRDVDYLDASVVIYYYGDSGSPAWIPADINNDGTVNYLDASLLVTHYGESY